MLLHQEEEAAEEGLAEPQVEAEASKGLKLQHRLHSSSASSASSSAVRLLPLSQGSVL